MGEFFKPWRRKIGCVTLLLACVFMGGWVRGKWFVDRLRFWPDGLTQFCCFSCPIGIGWQRIDITKGGPSKWVGIRSLSMDYFLIEHVESFFVFTFKEEFQWEWAGFRYGEYGSSDMPPAPPCVEEIRIWIVPYGIITVPLTLVSAFLLLSKPRKSTQKKIAELIHEKVE